MMTEIKCLKCNDTGRWIEETRSERISESVTMLSGSMSRLCECRKEMPRVHGDAKWWTMEPVKSITIPLTILEAKVFISTELPISEDNRPLIRDASNFYWPSFASVEIESDSLCAFELRDLAAGLLNAADEMDAFDKERSELANPAGAK